MDNSALCTEWLNQHLVSECQHMQCLKFLDGVGSIFTLQKCSRFRESDPDMPYKLL